MKHARITATRLVLVLAMLLSAVALATPDADAVQSGLVCDEGVRVGPNCEIEGPAPVRGEPVCPVSAQVMFEDNECFQVVEGDTQCPEFSVLVDDGCRQEVELRPGPLTCAEGFGLVAGRCLMFEIPLPDPQCPEGAELTFDGSQCIVTGDGPFDGPPTCPVGGPVVELDGECFVREPIPVGECPLNTTPDPNDPETGECRSAVEERPGPLMCEDSNFGLVNGECVRYETPVDDYICEVGIPSAPDCELEPLPLCPPSADEDELGCFVLVFRDPSGNCPAFSEPFDDLTCRREISQNPNAGGCIEGFTLFNDKCIGDEPAILVLTCAEGDLVNDEVCVIRGDDPVRGPGSCPVSVTVMLFDGECFRLVSRSAGTCEAGTTLDPAEPACRRQVVLVSSLICDDDFGLVDGTCIRFIDAIEELICFEGELNDADLCEVEGAAPVSGPGVCPVGGNVISDETGCYTLTEPMTVCGVGTTPDPSGEGCRLPVELTPGPLTCDDDFGLIGNKCIRFEPAVYKCAGLTVTINMRLGASGFGTNGDDVILGTNGADLIIARGGNDVICAGNGNDFVSGGRGADTIYGQRGSDDLRGGGGADDIRGGSGNDNIRGGGSHDELRGGSGNDIIRGGGGNDLIRGGRGDDAMSGNRGTDLCNGGSNSDFATRSCETIVNVP